MHKQPQVRASRAILLSLCLLWSCPFSAYAQNKNTVAEEQRKLQLETADLSRQIDSIRRDQLNYKIEKDLLKEAYSSNLQSINQVITLVLGVFGVLGFLGIRSIREIQQDHKQELERIKALKGNFEEELTKLRQYQQQFDSQVNSLAEENSKQDRRLKALEVIEKVAALVRQRNYFWALQNIEAGLPLSPDDMILLTYKLQCLGRLGRPVEAASVCERLLTLEPDNTGHVTNLLEYQAIGGQSQAFDTTYQMHKAKVDSSHDGALSHYLRMLRLGFIGEIDTLHKEVLSFTEGPADAPAKSFLEGWSFEDAQVAIGAFQDAQTKPLLQAIVNCFSGEIPLSALRELITKQDDPILQLEVPPNASVT